MKSFDWLFISMNVMTFNLIIFSALIPNLKSPPETWVYICMGLADVAMVMYILKMAINSIPGGEEILNKEIRRNW